MDDGVSSAKEKERKKDEGAPSSIRDEVERMDLPAARAALSDAVQKLDQAVQLASPDCPTARSLRDRICELSGRICRLTSGPDPLCKDSSARCESAKTRVASECP
ncbi:MAG TPA: hypothetical protein VHE30_22840 [Polyangiaceae bacterium]|nr:hypothetical protein [Polyangiaceae bacterium]